MNSGYIPVVGAPMTFPASSTPHHRRLSSIALELTVVGSIVNRIKPSVQSLLDTGLIHDHDTLVRHAVRTNIRMSVGHLRTGSAVLEHLIANEGLLVVGAEYSLETGVVEFLDT